MVRVSASEFQRQFGRLRTLAHREPVIVTSHGRDDTVLISADRFRQLNRLCIAPKEVTYEQLTASRQPDFSGIRETDAVHGAAASRYLM